LEDFQTPLQTLNLSTNSIGDDGLECIIAGLAVNETLKNLNLNSNKITDVGLDALYCCLIKSNEVLNSVQTSHNLGSDSRADLYARKRQQQESTGTNGALDSARNATTSIHDVIHAKAMASSNRTFAFSTSKSTSKGAMLAVDDINTVNNDQRNSGDRGVGSKFDSKDDQDADDSDDDNRSHEPAANSFHSCSGDALVVVPANKPSPSSPQPKQSSLKDKQSSFDDWSKPPGGGAPRKRESVPDIRIDNRGNRFLTFEKKLVNFFTPPSAQLPPHLRSAATEGDGKRDVNGRRVATQANELGRTIGVPYLSNLSGVQPVRTNISEHSDSGQNFAFIKVYTSPRKESSLLKKTNSADSSKSASAEDGSISKPYSLIEIARDRENEIERVKKERQTQEYKNAKAEVTRVDRILKSKKVERKADLKPPPKEFWDQVKLKVIPCYFLHGFRLK